MADFVLSSLQALLNRLLHTAEEPRLTATHRAASCNALSAFLEQAAALPFSEVRMGLLSGTAMTRALRSYLQSSGDSQSKPMRQLLRVLVNLLLADFPNGSYALVVRDIIKLCLYHISSDGDMSCVKAAMSLVTIFIQKHVISVKLLLSSESTMCPQTAIENQIMLSRPDADMQQSSRSFSSILSGFISRLMGWMRHAETGPAAGRLILALVGCIDDATNLDDSLASASTSSCVAVWVEPVLNAVHQRPELLEKLEQHLLPELLRMNLSHTEELLRILPIEELCRGNIGRLNEEDLRLCLVVIRVVEELGATTLLGKAIGPEAL